MGNLAQTGASMNLGCINALSTLGGQQQTIGQNAENFDLTKLASLGSLLQGYSIPVGTKTTLCMSPFSAAGALGSSAMGLITPKYDAAGKAIANSSPLNSIAGTLGNLFGGSSNNSSNSCNESLPIDCYFNNPNQDCISTCCCCLYAASGGLIKPKARGYTGCAPTASRGALPAKKG
jgi:hypothetical protein